MINGMNHLPLRVGEVLMLVSEIDQIARLFIHTKVVSRRCKHALDYELHLFPNVSLWRGVDFCEKRGRSNSIPLGSNERCLS